MSLKGVVTSTWAKILRFMYTLYTIQQYCYFFSVVLTYCICMVLSVYCMKQGLCICKIRCTHS